MTGARYLIVNADDLGLSVGVNEGIFRAHDAGIVTSASLMVRRAAAGDAAAGARGRPRLGVGLHLDLGDWVFAGGEWRASGQVVDPDDADAVLAEARRQLDAFRSLAGSDPTHLDSHQHVHLAGPAGAAARALADELGVPLRDRDPRVRYCGDFYGQTGTGEPLPELITPAALAAIIRELAAGVTELACHPAADPAVESPYARERVLELDALCDPLVARAVRAAGVELRSFAELPD